MDCLNHKAAVQQKLAENRRLAILRLLGEDLDLSLNTSMLEDALELLGINVSRDVIHADGAWLEEVGAISIERLDPVVIYKLSELGVNHLKNKTVIPGIKKPRNY